jgi:hypothetical protein
MLPRSFQPLRSADLIQLELPLGGPIRVLSGARLTQSDNVKLAKVAKLRNSLDQIC